LEEALTESRFWNCLEATRRKTKRPRGEFRIAIKPDLDFFDPVAPTGTSPALVEALIERLIKRGYLSVTVFDGRNVDDSWLHNRSPLNVPDLVGYRFMVDSGEPYNIAGLNDDVRPVFPEGHPLHKFGMCCAWLEADFRIIFAKNKTDENFAYALGAYNLLGCLPEARRDGAEGADVRPAELCLDVLRQSPIHFCLIDAVVSSHGSAGSRVPRPNETKSLIASSNLLLADWVGATKMGVDPYASTINAKALRAIGLPEDFHIEGDLSVYPLWENPHPLVVKSAPGRASRLTRLTRPLLQPTDREAFPFRDVPLDRINAYLTRGYSDSNGSGQSSWLPVGLNYLLTLLDNVSQSVNMMYLKQNVRRVERPPQFDYESIPKTTYDSVRKHVTTREQMVQGAPANRHGHQLRLIDGAILFQAKQVIAKSYAKFIENVEIHRSIQFMSDYIGGSAICVSRQRGGLVTRQAERNLYLPQPNWTVLFGGKLIDVEKIEVLAYGDNWRKIWWRTIDSPNNTADLDDGSVEFRRTPDGLTQVTIFTHQKFTLPPLLAALQIDSYPEVYDALAAAAYYNFFSNTIRNLQLKADRLPYRIGRIDELAGTSAAADLSVWLATIAAALTELFGQHQDILKSMQRFFAPIHSTQQGGHVDEHGFRHFPAPPQAVNGHNTDLAHFAGSILKEAPEFLAGLADAIRKDVSHAAAPVGHGNANGKPK
jgi:uncharacterized protein (DUF362 family)